MTFKITTSRKFKKLLKDNDKDGLIPKVRKEFKKKGPLKVKHAIVQDMIRGISPVKGGGKWAKYSVSYKDIIKNRAAYRVIKGKVVRFSKFDDITSKEAKSLRASKEALSQIRGKQKDAKQLIKELNADYHKAASPSKRISPVNLRHTGKLHRSLKVFMKGGVLRRASLVIQFKHFLADIHNRRGAGKSKKIRRLLPTKKGETFNNRINTVMLDELKKAVDKIAKQFSGQ